MIKVIAEIELYKAGGRTTPFASGYRPLFNFVKGMKTSGQITLIDREEFKPGDKGIVEVAFLNDKFLGKNFSQGTTFTFDEGLQSLGEGKVLQLK